MPKNEMLDEVLDEVLDEAFKRIQHFKTTFVFDLDQPSSSMNLQMLDESILVAERPAIHPPFLLTMLDEMLEAY